MDVTAYGIAARFIGVKEIQGSASNPLILAMLDLDSPWPREDEVSWCSAFVNFVAFILGLPRSKSLAARSWLAVGTGVQLSEARAEFDVVVLSRGTGPQPGPEVLDAAGHVAFFSGNRADGVSLLGGNQGDAVSIETFDAGRVLGVRRLLH